MLSSILLFAAATPVTIEVGRFNPSDFPEALKFERRMPQADLTNRVERILDKECKLEGQTKIRFDIVVPYAIRLKSDGEPNRVVVKEIGCPQIERLVGEIALELAKAGDFKIDHGAGERWYVSDAYFTRGSDEDARSMQDDDKIVCKKTVPKLGSRLAMVKTCRTVAQWRLYDKERAQLHRDMNGQDPRVLE